MLGSQKNFLQKYQQIYNQNQLWNAIEYKLQLNLGNSSAYLQKVYSVSNPYLTAQFEKQTKGHIVSDIFVKPEELTGTNRIERVCQKGFEFPSQQTGLQFTMGQVDIDPLEKDQHQLIMVKICPKKSYPTYQNDMQNQKLCPSGFQSIYYIDKNEDKGFYKHRFRLYKKLQVLPVFVIHFNFNQQHQKQLKHVLCQNCQDQIAKIYCVTEKVYFCKQCDYEHHKDKISARHERIDLKDKQVLDFGFCKNHRNNKNQLFCKTCNSSLCMSCKIYGDHAEGFMSNHELLKINHYYNGAIKTLDEIDPNLDRRKYQLEQLLCYLDDQIDLINRQVSKLQTQLKEIFERTLIQIETISKQKLSYLMTEQLEVKRQYDFIQWMQSFLRYERKVLPPNDFLIAWTKHEKLRKQVLNVSNIPGVTQIRANMRIVGSIDIDQNFHDELQETEKKQAYNRHLDKFNHSIGNKKNQNSKDTKNNNQFRKKLLYIDNQ